MRQHLMMRLEVGPIDAGSARAWIANARAVLAGVRRAGDRLPLDLPPEVGEAFDRYLDQWEEAARDRDVFLWADDIDTEQVRHLVVYWFSLLTLDDDTWRELGLPFAPAESEPFYLALSEAVTDTLAEADAEVGTTIKASWPEETSIPTKPSLDQPRRVVVIDDNEDLRLLFATALSLDGRFEVVGEAANGAEGVELCRRLQPDGLLIDVRMPVMDGLTAVPLIREACPSARIVVLSAEDSPQVVETATANGADAFVTKGTALDRALDELLG
jgi:CheY-like chemotaxis protein